MDQVNSQLIGPSGPVQMEDEVMRDDMNNMLCGPSGHGSGHCSRLSELTINWTMQGEQVDIPIYMEDELMQSYRNYMLIHSQMEQVDQGGL